MRVKRFVAPSMPEAIALVKAEFGPDAVILNTGKARQPGWLGWLRPRWVAVTAGCDEAPPKVVPEAPVETREDPVPEVAAAVEEVAVVEETKQPVEQRSHQIKLTELTVIYLLERLRHQDVAPQHLEELRGELRSRVSQGGEAPRLQLMKLLAEKMPLAETWQVQEGPLIVPLIGPTGVGKTTTIAKLATSYALLYGWRVGFISADTYRVAAVEQLRTYAEILDVPMEVVYSPDEVAGALERLSDRQLILLDTAGRSHYIEEHMVELGRFLEAVGESRVHLVLNSTTRYGDLVETIDSFSSYATVAGLIMTKLDETRSYGSLYNAVRRLEKPIAFIANGQSVPEDLEAADPIRLAGLLVGV